MFFQETNFLNVRAYLTDRIELFSCFSYDEEKFRLMRDDFSEGNLTYLLISDELQGGYVRLIDLGDNAHAVDIVVPRNLHNILEEIALFCRDELDSERVLVNYDITWIEEELDESDVFRERLNLPQRNVVRHFGCGEEEYKLVDLLQVNNLGTEGEESFDYVALSY
jgi:hypothetical protein